MSEQLHILIMSNSIFSIDEYYKQKILDIAPGAVLIAAQAKETTKELIRQADIIYGWPEVQYLKDAENLKWLHLPSAGADGYTNKASYYNKDIILTNSSGVFGLPIAEHVFAMILSYNRNLQEYAYDKKEKIWKGLTKTRDFYGSTIGIIGLGDIGTEIAKRAKAWGAEVLAVKRTITEVPEYVDKLYSLEDIDEVLTQSDYVVLALPNTQKTQGIMNEEKLKKMKPHAFLVNIGRGALIDQEALIKALQENWIGGAGLDVTTPEPLPEDSPLWELPNVILTPHTSGSSPSNITRRFEMFNRNLKLFLENKPLENLVDFTEGY
ncbi:D-2-hydroxyacid dehydrogenase [Anaerocolumna sp. AGMB13025]|uniref:D-2-hydroxyacid dehydrogenase n=1 Tax=Anaerocolumna sp. AGMB13025 TaxID=3039116 RepID=UPI00241EA5F1|nr:D-2-hydroxyacid dehydrogenase [Anaerocolumna sp. AGMB13025]WFR59294.1 D-2-hydroxyacid dehydrogenase [Anaerocolumna sp. AGMB13025]